MCDLRLRASTQPQLAGHESESVVSERGQQVAPLAVVDAISQSCPTILLLLRAKLAEMKITPVLAVSR